MGSVFGSKLKNSFWLVIFLWWVCLFWPGLVWSAKCKGSYQCGSRDFYGECILNSYDPPKDCTGTNKADCESSGDKCHCGNGGHDTCKWSCDSDCSCASNTCVGSPCPNGCGKSPPLGNGVRRVRSRRGGRPGREQVFF